ncbi:uncharacterized protein BDW43DRAFT_311268 [Aspergillus alliaceus]|uniref:uncharacterized protein n=1 Tax=Petromyces alliaceus TaxID=209559 RepID=UPI0012A5569A|nr:uncharacterized protein BDW43DRAFT_311268 [Aspergillus alliaceus]KAB8233194.1 hypothetical protein BDW43DRAFT_311268 [Aspergillus alliaceus]
MEEEDLVALWEVADTTVEEVLEDITEGTTGVRLGDIMGEEDGELLSMVEVMRLGSFMVIRYFTIYVMGYACVFEPQRYVCGIKIDLQLICLLEASDNVFALDKGVLVP